MRLEFRSWVEDKFSDRLVNTKASVRYNETAVDLYVRSSSNDSLCTLLVNKFTKGGRGVIKQLPPVQISGNLLGFEDDKLGQAITVYDSVHVPARFKFYDEGEQAGNIWLRFAPVIFTQKDRILLKSIVIHELQHAEDWAKGGYQPMESGSSYEFNMDEYLSRVDSPEARALYSQLRYLLKRIGNVDEVVKLLSGQRPDTTEKSPLAMRAELVPVAAEFLAHFKGLGEGLGSFMLPLAVGAGMAGQPSTPDFSRPAANLDRPSKVYNIQQEDARTAANVVMRIMALFVFSQYVQSPR